MPTGRSCGVGLWKALRVSATKIATKAALATMKPASARYWAGYLRALIWAPCRHLRPP